jgi:hypothetical protein
MAGEGQECRCKHHHEAGGSGSSRAPTAHPKKLAKSARPISLREESSPEDSPPHGGTPESPDELECLKIRSLVIHTNQKVVNYSKDDPMNLIREDSPPHGSSPKSLDELECLKIRSPAIHTNWEVVNYSKEDPMNLITLHNKPCYNSSKERGIDEIFWTFFHQYWYWIVIYPKTSLVVKHQWVHIDYMRNKKDMHFNRTLEACDFHGITDLL